MYFGEILESLGKEAQSFPFHLQRGVLFVKEMTLKDENSAKPESGGPSQSQVEFRTHILLGLGKKGKRARLCANSL